MATATVTKPNQASSVNPNTAPAQRVVSTIQPLKFRVLTGQHSGLDKDMKERLWRTNDIVECYRRNGQPFDLAKRFNQPDAIKFQLVSADTPSSKGLFLEQGNPIMDPEETEAYEAQSVLKGQRLDGTDDMFDSMALPELRKYAEENEIPIDGIKTQEAMLEAIRQYENLSSVVNR